LLNELRTLAGTEEPDNQMEGACTGITKVILVSAPEKNHPDRSVNGCEDAGQ
jgi:hypothetical protein